MGFICTSRGIDSVSPSPGRAAFAKESLIFRDVDGLNDDECDLQVHQRQTKPVSLLVRITFTAAWCAWSCVKFCVGTSIRLTLLPLRVWWWLASRTCGQALNVAREAFHSERPQEPTPAVWDDRRRSIGGFSHDALLQLDEATEALPATREERLQLNGRGLLRQDIVALGLEKAMGQQDVERAQLMSNCKAAKTQIAHVQHEAKVIGLAQANIIKTVNADVAKLNLTSDRLKSLSTPGAPSCKGRLALVAHAMVALSRRSKDDVSSSRNLWSATEVGRHARTQLHRRLAPLRNTQARRPHNAPPTTTPTQKHSKVQVTTKRSESGWVTQAGMAGPRAPTRRPSQEIRQVLHVLDCGHSQCQGEESGRRAPAEVPNEREVAVARGCRRAQSSVCGAQDSSRWRSGCRRTRPCCGSIS
jgi:hypothetical protein